MQGFSDPRLKWDAKLLRLALDLERGVTQVRVGRDAELLRLASNASLLRPASKVSMLLDMRGLRFNSKRYFHIEVRLAFDDLSLVIFGQSIVITSSKDLRHLLVYKHLPLRLQRSDQYQSLSCADNVQQQ